MDAYEEKLRNFLSENEIAGEHLVFQEICHSVADAAKAARADPDDFVKNICLTDPDGDLIVAILKGEDRVDTEQVAKILGVEKVRRAILEEMLEKSGYPCGGIPSFGFSATFLIDPRVMEKETVYTGGGSEYSLIRISPIELQKANKGTIVRIRK